MVACIRILLLCVLFFPLLLHAQQPAKLMPKDSTARDSIINQGYPYVFPIWGEKTLKRGFDIPYPAGVMLNFYAQNQDYVIDNLSIGINGSEQVDVSFLEFGEITGRSQVLNFRPDLWIFPFLNVYGILAYGNTTTGVAIEEPFQYRTSVELSGWAYGFGATAAFGVGPVWIAVDANTSWSDLDLLDDAVRASIISPRIGHTFVSRNKRGENLAIWVGAMYQSIDARTVGTVPLDDLFDGITEERKDEIQASVEDWYETLNPGQQIVIDRFFDALQDKVDGGNTSDVSIDYNLDKKPAQAWNMLIGFQYQLNKHWMFRGEGGFLGQRNSALLSVNYRFRL
ncbi:hypothetical protein [Pontibacter sp. G13]|uniref:hypothetical protein n=1 Tax=Pontibacter sp. G13 TaxID=3074898 RepID=UPI0028897F23|nr:hypothetical protein [Pontibacter sp. G13]WNJ17409.1 hypothetical protein RJD25_21385 [Pontibacter sp. G13]